MTGRPASCDDVPMTTTATTSPTATIYTDSTGVTELPAMTAADARQIANLLTWMEAGQPVALLGDGYVIEGKITAVYFNSEGVCANVHGPGESPSFHCGPLYGAVIAPVVETVYVTVRGE